MLMFIQRLVYRFGNDFEGFPGESLAYANAISWPLTYLWRTFVTPLSYVVLTLYLAWCLFRIIDISHIPRWYGN